MRVLVVLLLGLVACLPGREGWECQLNASEVQVFRAPKNTQPASDCNEGLYCQSMSGYSRGGQTSKSICVASGTKEVSSTYNWMHVILSWAGVGIAAIALAIFTVKRVRRRRA